MPLYASWTNIGLTYLIVLLIVLFTLVIVATYFTWNKAKPLKSKSSESESKSSSLSSSELDAIQTQTVSVPPMISAFQKSVDSLHAMQFLDEEEEMVVEPKAEDVKHIQNETEIQKENNYEIKYELVRELQAESKKHANEERLLPQSSLDVHVTKPAGKFVKFLVSSKLVPLLQDHAHPGFIVMFHSTCANTQEALQTLTAEYGPELSQTMSQLSIHRGFHVTTLTTALRDRLLRHPFIGDIHEDGWMGLNLPPHNPNENASDKESKLRKLQSLSAQQIVPWSVVRVGGKKSSLKIGSRLPNRNYDQVAVFALDSGMDTTHPDLVQGMWSRNMIVPLVRQLSSKQYDPTNVADEHGHGTHVAGIIGAIDNGIGIVGTCPGVPIHAVKVLDRNGIGSLSTLLSGIQYCLQLATKHPEFRFLVHTSVGSSDPCELLDACIERSRQHLTFVMAAGNDQVDVSTTSPARTALQCNTISVGSFDQRNSFSSYSNFGQGLTILAPGENILSTYKNGSYAFLSGTSMSSACVTGVVAGYLSTLQDVEKRKETPQTLKQKLQLWSTQASAQESQQVSSRRGAYTCSRSVFMKF